jgi:hypothetical protein
MRKIQASLAVCAALVAFGCNHENHRAMTPASGTTTPPESPGMVSGPSVNGAYPGVAGSAAVGSGTTGSGTTGSDTTGSGTTGSGTAGSGTIGSGTTGGGS